MIALTYNQYKSFVQGVLEIKVVNKENLFYNEIFPVIAIGKDFVDCDVLHHQGTQSFDFEDVEIFKEIRIIEDGFGNSCSAICPQCKKESMQIVRPGKFQCKYCG